MATGSTEAASSGVAALLELLAFVATALPLLLLLLLLLELPGEMREGVAVLATELEASSSESSELKSVATASLP